jgi:hypothetical protein
VRGRDGGRGIFSLLVPTSVSGVESLPFDREEMVYGVVA